MNSSAADASSVPLAAAPAPLTGVAGRVHGRSVPYRLIAAALALAGAIHLVLIPEHFGESPLFGVTFTGIAAVQLGLAAVFWRGPGRRAHRIALGATLAILAVWAGTRFVEPPTGSGPEEVDAWGVVAAGVELAAVVLLASTIPASSGRPRRRWLWAAAGALGFAVIYLIASGSAGTGVDRGGPLLEVRTFRGEFSLLVPGWALLIDGGRAYVTVPWTTLVFLPVACALIATQIRLSLAVPTCEARLGARRRGVLSLLPALVAAPVCCAAPLLAFLGTGALLTVGTITPWLLIATCALLGVATWRAWLERRRIAGHGLHES